MNTGKGASRAARCSKPTSVGLLPVLLCFFLAACRPAAPLTATPGPPPLQVSARYLLAATVLDLAALDGYPQRIIRTRSAQSPFELEIEVQLDPSRAQPIYWAEYDYPAEAAPYRLASPLVESTAPEVCDWAHTFYIYEGDIVSYGTEVLLWMSQNIRLDPDLEAQVNSGQVQPLGAARALKQATAASADMAHLFIAAMRCQGVPARFISGYVYPGGFQSWVEVYLYGVGWAPADPPTAVFNITPAHIRLFAAADFAEIHQVPAKTGLNISPLP